MATFLFRPVSISLKRSLLFKSEQMFKYIIIALLFCACTPSKKITVEKIKPANVDSLMYLMKATQWEGYLPCADCSGIRYQLTLRNNQSYEGTMIYEGKNVNPFVEDGRWSISSQGRLILSSGSKTEMKYLIEDKSLRMLDQNGHMIHGSLSENYVLYPKAIIPEGNWIHQSERGVNFAATGNEPFWSLEIIFGKSMHFNTPDGYEIMTPFVEGENAADANVTRYRAATDSGELSVQISKRKCINSMSGMESDYQVSIRVKKHADTEREYDGCGNFIGNYRLNDIWGLTGIGGNALTVEDLKKGMPTLDLQITTKKVYGFGGCNRFTGNILITDKTIAFDKMATTMRACPDLKVENRFLKILSNATFEYRIEGLKLYLGKGKEQLQFKKLD